MTTMINTEPYNDKFIILEAHSKHYMERIIAVRKHVIRSLIKIQIKIWFKSFLVMIGLKKSNK